MNEKEEVFNGIAQHHFKGIDVGKGCFDVTHLGPKALELRPVEIHHKVDGSIKDEPCFLIVMQGSKYIPASVYGQITLEMLNAGLKEIGYKIEPLIKEPDQKSI